MKYEFYICDVFTSSLYGGNQLAVIPDAQGLTDDQMLSITREFNFSETSFVFPPEQGFTKKVRIFTPGGEVPFAGHPNVGTAYVLAKIGAFGVLGKTHKITFEEKAGPVEIHIHHLESGNLYATLKAPQPFTMGKTIPTADIARALTIPIESIKTDIHKPLEASVGLPFIMVEVDKLNTLQSIKPNIDAFHNIEASGVWPSIHVYLRSMDNFDLRTRMFAPLTGVPEDPATGSANVALSALLSHLDPKDEGKYEYMIAQGIEMGRPSTLKSKIIKKAGKIESAWIGGEAVISCKGNIRVS